MDDGRGQVRTHIFRSQEYARYALVLIRVPLIRSPYCYAIRIYLFVRSSPYIAAPPATSMPWKEYSEYLKLRTVSLTKYLLVVVCFAFNLD